MTSDIIQRVTEWLESLVSDPAAAAEFAESPPTSLANYDLSQSDLDGVDLKSVAGGLGGSGGVSPEGREVLTQFARSAGSSGGGGHDGGSQIQHVAHVTRAVHQDNPTVTKVFNDNSVNVDNSTSFVNNGFVGGDINLDNDVNVADDGAVIVGQGADNATVATTGGVAGSGDADVTANTGVLKEGTVAGGNVDDTVNGEGNTQVNPDGDRPEESPQGGQGGQEGQDDLPFGQGDTGHRDEQHRNDQQDQHGQDEQSEEKQGGEPDAPEGQDQSSDHDDTQPQPDPTHGESESDDQHFESKPVPEDGLDAHPDPEADHLLDA